MCFIFNFHAVVGLVVSNVLTSKKACQIYTFLSLVLDLWQHPWRWFPGYCCSFFRIGGTHAGLFRRRSDAEWARCDKHDLHLCLSVSLCLFQSVSLSVSVYPSLSACILKWRTSNRNNKSLSLGRRQVFVFWLSSRSFFLSFLFWLQTYLSFKFLHCWDLLLYSLFFFFFFFF